MYFIHELKWITSSQTLTVGSVQRWWLMCGNRKWLWMKTTGCCDDRQCFVLWLFNFLSYYMEKTFSDSQIEKSLKHTTQSSSSKLHLNRIHLLIQHSSSDSSLTFNNETTSVGNPCVSCRLGNLYNSVIDMLAQTCKPAGCGSSPKTALEIIIKKQPNMLLWCSQQWIIRFLLTGLKQYIPFFCPATTCSIKRWCFSFLSFQQLFSAEFYPTPTIECLTWALVLSLLWWDYFNSV